MTVRIVPLPSAATLDVGVDPASALLDALDDAGERLADDDVVVVASKVVALAEGELVALPDDADVHAARRRIARAEARRVVADHERVLVVETHHGLVCANAGVDTSNVPPGHAVLLPRDPDASARRLRDDLAARTGTTVGVVVTDTFGRPWRLGQVDVAIGAAGIRVLRDERRGHDLWGRPLEVTVAALADELAAAADLVRGKDTRVAFVLLRGLDVAGSGVAADLVRDPAEDLFPVGGPTMADHVVAGATRVPADGDDPAAQVHAVVAMLDDEAVHATGVGPTDDRARVSLTARDPGADGLVALGRTLAHLDLLAHARGWSTVADTPTDGFVEVVVEVLPGQSSTTKSR